ncbi:MAG: antitoxin [Candidatus Peribacteria bacterium]|jgi:predicted DNA binding CopG/RHH family protein|nr:antitoxin [Candidatus Peribacteria bacterium]
MAKKVNTKYLDNEEKELLENMDYGKVKSVPNLKKEIAKYQEIAKKQYSKKRAISIRLLEYDIAKLKAKSIEE